MRGKKIDKLIKSSNESDQKIGLALLVSIDPERFFNNVRILKLGREIVIVTKELMSALTGIVYYNDTAISEINFQEICESYGKDYRDFYSGWDKQLEKFLKE